MKGPGPEPRTVDLLVIGGGINGASIARDAAGRGLAVLLCEKDDLATHTSSASTKLIHGGLRYLEHYDFRLVRHSLQEREVLLRNAPHIIWPLRFVLPHHAGLRPRWLIRLGLFLYDHLGGRKRLPASRGVDLRTHIAGRALKRRYRRGYEYSDCWVQDSRLVVLNALDAHRRGAEVRTRTTCVSLACRGARWEAVLVEGATGARSVVSARGVVNATGPWVGKTLDLIDPSRAGDAHAASGPPARGTPLAADEPSAPDDPPPPEGPLTPGAPLAASTGTAARHLAVERSGIGVGDDRALRADTGACPDVASTADTAARHPVRLVKGSHIVVGKRFDHPHPYTFQGGDGRVLFAIPFEDDYTLLGTTEVETDDEPGPVSITPREIDYICATANAYFERPIAPADVVWSYSGIRPLFDDQTESASEVTRDYVLRLDRSPAPLLSVYGGKITTCRRLAEQVVDRLAGPLGVERPAWTRDAPLPGGDVPDADIGAFTASCVRRYRWLREDLVRHYVRHYGTGIHALLAGCTSVDGLGEHFGAGLHAVEVEHLVEHEWARTAEDILWRRTRKGLRVPSGGVGRLRRYLGTS